MTDEWAEPDGHLERDPPALRDGLEALGSLGTITPSSTGSGGRTSLRRVDPGQPEQIVNEAANAAALGPDATERVAGTSRGRGPG